MASPRLSAARRPADAPDRVERLLRELGGRVQRGAVPAVLPAPCPTGIADLDALLGGGLRRGDLAEITGPASSGRTSLALSLLARATASGELAAVVDVADAFDPLSGSRAGVELERLLWVRAPGFLAALRSVAALLEARGFAVVLLDLADLALAGRSDPELARRARVWPRLRKQLAGTDSALVVMGAERVVHSFADLSLRLQPGRVRFSGLPSLLDPLEGEVVLARNRRGPEDRRVQIRW